jgi:hypothetical protein|mmetsp:Transcript_7536/g.968  ORF Transcript_7536/g.968 Transcript_7536/m.968 type:complete len:87 (+) Transcript_7536:237-497(+)
MICETTLDDTILSVCLNRIRIVVCTEENVFIYDTATMKLQETIKTVLNPRGLIALSPTYTACYLLYPSSVLNGNLQIYDGFTMQTV